MIVIVHSCFRQRREPGQEPVRAALSQRQVCIFCFCVNIYWCTGYVVNINVFFLSFPSFYSSKLQLPMPSVYQSPWQCQLELLAWRECRLFWYTHFLSSLRSFAGRTQGSIPQTKTNLSNLHWKKWTFGNNPIWQYCHVICNLTIVVDETWKKLIKNAVCSRKKISRVNW